MMVKQISILFTICLMLTGGNGIDGGWQEVEGKMWISNASLGSHIVFLRNVFNEQKAIFQRGGSGCIVVSTTIFDVDTSDGTIRLIVAPTNKPKTGMRLSEYRYSIKNDSLIAISTISPTHTLEQDFLPKTFTSTNQSPKVYKSCSQPVDIEFLKRDTITINDFR